jgi:hypothetical protein
LETVLASRTRLSIALAVVSLAVGSLELAMSLAITSTVDSEACEGMRRRIASAAAVPAPLGSAVEALGIGGCVFNGPWDTGRRHACDTARNNERRESAVYERRVAEDRRWFRRVCVSWVGCRAV